jgi:hypothetical protein
MALDLETLWDTKLEPELLAIQKKLDKINGRTQQNKLAAERNALHIKAHWFIIAGMGGLFVYWLRCLIRG